jgi:hypothetical protein
MTDLSDIQAYLCQQIFLCLYKDTSKKTQLNSSYNIEHPIENPHGYMSILVHRSFSAPGHIR